VLRVNVKGQLVSKLLGSCLALLLAIGITSCDRSPSATDNLAAINATDTALVNTDGPLLEVNTPASIAKLAPSLDKYQPQVQILSPKPDETLTDDRVTVKLKVTDLPLFKQPELGLGNHLHVTLDRQTYQGVYDLSQPLVFKNLAAGTHSLRVFASRPWHESFKNAGAYAQVKFHVLTKTADNNPDPQQPLLTFSRPTGTYGTEPIMLDYYLINAPFHPATSDSTESLPDWRVRVTVNDQRFILDRWAPVYLQGFKQGKNWVRLELLDDRGNPIPNVYNDSLAIFTYDPQTSDALARLIRGDLNPELAQTLVDPNYVAIQPALTPAIAPKPTTTPTPIVPNPVAIAPPPVIQPSPNPVLAPIVKTSPPPRSEVSSAPVKVDEQRSPSLSANDRPQPVASPTVAPSDQQTEIPTSPARPPQITPNPVAMPTPAVAIVPSPPHPPSQPIAVPSPVLTPDPAPRSAPPAIVPPTNSADNSLPPPQPISAAAPKEQPINLPASQRGIPPRAATPAVESKEPDRPIAPATTPNVPTSLEPKDPKTWQTEAIEVSNVIRAKIRAFTNTIPAKAQRFGHNLQTWYGKASELVRELRNIKNSG
jgi:hypothetical protein